MKREFLRRLYQKEKSKEKQAESANEGIASRL